MKPVYPLIVVALALGYIVYKIYLGPKLRIAKATRAYKERNRHKFEKINNAGFTLFTEGEAAQIRWNDIISLVLHQDGSITGDLINGDKIVIHNDCVNRLEFIKKVPKGIADYDYELVTQYFDSLETCPVCGFKSLDQGDCLNCEYSITYEEEHKGNSNREDFLKEEQLDYLTVYYDLEESVEKTLKKAKQSNVFEHDKNWNLYPTTQEIKQAKRMINRSYG